MEPILGIARRLGIFRNTVRKCLRSPQVPPPSHGRGGGSTSIPTHPNIRQHLAGGGQLCAPAAGGPDPRVRRGTRILEEFVKPHWSPRSSQATMRYETKPGEQAQVDFGRYLTPYGQERAVAGGRRGVR